jgi:hypothetical protein
LFISFVRIRRSSLNQAAVAMPFLSIWNSKYVPQFAIVLEGH